MNKQWFEFKNCWVLVETDKQLISTYYDDGTIARAIPQDTEEYRATAVELGYGTDVWKMTVEHELMHTALAELRGEHHSGSLWAQAHKPEGFEFDPKKDMPKKGQEEEDRLFVFQKLLNKMRLMY